MTPQKNESISYSKEKFVVSLKGNCSKYKIAKLCNQWIMQKAEKYLVSRTKTLSKKTNLKPSGIAVKWQKGMERHLNVTWQNIPEYCHKH
jgi:hypothetical protein